MKRNIRAFSRNHTAVAALIVLLAVILFCIIYPFVSPHDMTKLHVEEKLARPSAEHLLGSDELGRDLLTRMAEGGRITLSVAFFSALIAALCGSVIGILCGFAGGRTDRLVMRVMDAVSSVPSLLLAIVFDYMLGMGRGRFLYGIAIAGIPPFARLVRAGVLEISGSAYVEASRALGASPAFVIREHVMRNILPLISIQAATAVADGLTTCTILGYIGVGINPPTPEWGAIFDRSRHYMRTYPHMSLAPAAAIVICIICLYLVGNGIRDSFSISGGDE